LNDAVHRENVFDPVADEFNFNFLGYSGKFMLDGNGQWVVTGNDNIKVIVDPVDGIVTEPNIRQEVKDKITSEMRQYNYKYFNRFKLITPDGVTYEFGGKDATEFTVSSYRSQNRTHPIASSWYLTKIISPTGKVITLNYQLGPIIASLANTYSGINFNRPVEDGFIDVLLSDLSSGAIPASCGAFNNKPWERHPADGYVTYPIYLSQIVTSYATVDFMRSQSTELRYSDLDIKDIPTNDHFFWYTKDLLDFLQWSQLDKIIIHSSLGNLREFNFNYTKSPTTRLKLLSLYEVNEGTKYEFQYNPEPLPAYCSNQIDQWGYYNGFDFTTISFSNAREFIDLYPSTREPDKSANSKYIKAELLEKVIYPTGGYTLYEYEPHRYSKSVSPDRASPLTEYLIEKNGGGARIKKISSYDFNNSKLFAKEYYYVRGYSGQSDLSLLPSSGILGGLTQYYWPDFQSTDMGGNPFTYSLFSSNSLFPSFMNAQGSHIGYSEVVEKTVGNGYVKTFFSNFDADVFGNSHKDEAATFTIDKTRSIYSPFTSKAMERGYAQLVDVFSESNERITSTKNFYEAFNTYLPSYLNFVPTVSLEHLDICSGLQATAQVTYGTLYSNYIYHFVKTKEEVTTYSPNKVSSTTSVKNFHFDKNKLIDLITTTNSEGIELKTEIVYPTSILTFVPQSATPEARAIYQMWEANMLNYPIETINYFNGNITSAEVNTYSLASNIIVPAKRYKTELKSPIPASSYIKTFIQASSVLTIDSKCILSDTYNYGAFGNIKEYIGRDGIVTTFIWSYKQLFPVAKIVNASHQEVTNALGQSVMDGLGTATESNLRNTLETLRDNPAMKNAQISTYYYDPFQGVLNNMVDPNGNPRDFTYDGIGRLTLVKDRNGDIDKMFEYNYLKR
jgi:hypothetical protein